MAQRFVIACNDCDLLQRVPAAADGAVIRCVRCAAVLRRLRFNSLDRTLAFTVAALLLFAVANTFPFLAFEMHGQVTETTLLTGVRELYAQGMWALAILVLSTSVLVPAAQLVLLLYVLGSVKFAWRARYLGALFRWVGRLEPWEMLDVFMLGILVAVVKLSDMASIVPGISLWAFAGLILALAAAFAALDPAAVWERLGTAAGGAVASAGTLASAGPLVVCHTCRLPAPVPRTGMAGLCRRCGTRLHRRKPLSLQRTWALLIAAAICYLPANLLPVMTVTSLGSTQSDTILSGIVYLLFEGMWPLALVVFVASLVVPMLKLVVLVLLLVSVQRGSGWRRLDRTRLYRITEAIGRWSMVDIYVVTLLAALVQLGNLAQVQAGAGAVFFAAVVVLTMIAAITFDPRLIWDSPRRHDD